MIPKTSPTLAVQYQSIDTLTPHRGNTRRHSKRQIRQIAASIKSFGFTNPVLIDHKNCIVAGHGRVQAAKLLGIDQVPTIRLEDLTDDQVRAYVLADNRIAQKSSWDKSILAIELQHLLTIEGDFDVTVTGFDVSEIKLILGEANHPKAVTDESSREENSKSTVTQPGDLWLLGEHRVLCGSPTEESSFTSLMGVRRASIIFAGSEFLVGIGNSIMKTDEAEATRSLSNSLQQLSRWSSRGSVNFISIDWRRQWELLGAGRQTYDSIVTFVANALLDCSAPGDVVLDTVLGSGITQIAAERIGRVCFGIEIDPLFVDTVIRRWQNQTGARAIHSGTGKYFNDLVVTTEVPRG